MVKFMLFRKQSPESNATNQAIEASRTDRLKPSGPDMANTNKFIANLSNKITSGGTYYVSLNKKYTNNFVMELAKMDNIALFPVINGKSELSNVTYNAVRALATKTNNTNN